MHAFHFALCAAVCAASLPTQAVPRSRWLSQDTSPGFGVIRMDGSHAIGRFGGGAWGNVNGADFDGDGQIDLAISYGIGGGAHNTCAGLFVYRGVRLHGGRILDAGVRIAGISRTNGKDPVPYVGDANHDGRPDIWCNGWLCLNRSTRGHIRFARPRRYRNPQWPTPGECDWNRDGRKDRFESDWWRLRLKDGRTGQTTTLRVGDSDLLEDIFIRPFVCDWDHDGDPDILIGQESGHVTFIENRRGTLMAERHLQQINPNLKSGCLSVPMACDWYGTGNRDLVVGTAAGFVEVYRYQNGHFLPPQRLKAGGETLRITAGELGSIQGEMEARWGYVNPWAADWDMDGDLDLLLGTVTGEILLCENTGSRTHPSLAAPVRITVDWGSRRPAYPEGIRYAPAPDALVVEWRSRPVVMDWNHDGLPDLISIDESGYLACYPRYRRADGTLGLKPAEHPFVDERGNPLRFCANERPGANGRIVFCIADWKHDGLPHIIRNGGSPDGKNNLNSGSNFAYLQCLRVDASHRATYRWRGEMVPPHIISLQAHNSSPFALDVDGDGQLDLISGCEDGNLRYFTRRFLNRVAPGSAKVRHRTHAHRRQRSRRTTCPQPSAAALFSRAG